ncbi:hypothetical protein [Amycolatopsis eburnea]|uniref:hypothetical protein n=1 Tax=Amycolatopsis eburnea TaxID=2267691 RepID=UPI00131584D4|nr:hypothetical protein [Amycolatopsis eburnea]
MPALLRTATTTLRDAWLSQVRTGLRVSFGVYNTGDDVDRFTDILERGLRTLRPAG